MRRVLVVAEPPEVRREVSGLTRARGWEAVETEGGPAAERALLSETPDVAVLDLGPPDRGLLAFLPRLRVLDPGLPILGLAGADSPETAANAIRGGASATLPTPVDPPALFLLIDRLVEERRARRVEAVRRAERGRQRDPFIGPDPVIRQLEIEAGMAIRAESPILIHGAPGCGKRVLAEWLHQHGPRAKEPLAVTRCAGRPAGRLGADLFGMAPEAFGNASAEPGMLESAHHGSVILERVDQADANLQAELLRVLETGRIRRRGDTVDRSVDVRMMFSTRHDLVAMVADKRFREDLYYRICATALRVPALSERRDGIPALARALLDEVGHEVGEPAVGLTAEGERCLQSHPWPGNVRELRNALERAVQHSQGGPIGPEHLALDPTQPGRAAGLDQPISEIERLHIERVLEAEGGHVGRAGKRLGIPRSTLYQRLKQLGIRTGRR